MTAQAAAKTQGLHHVTAIAGDPQKNIDFYITGLGLRLVKKTVNFDDPGTYHLYYGDESGRPGSLMTFFPWRGIQQGRIGAGQSTSTAFSVPAGSLGWWVDHFAAVGAEARITSTSSSEERLLVADPDGLQIELVATHEHDPRDPWDSASVPAEYAIRGQHSSVLTVRDAERTRRAHDERSRDARGRAAGQPHAPRRRCRRARRPRRRARLEPRAAGPDGGRHGAPHRLPRARPGDAAAVARRARERAATR